MAPHARFMIMLSAILGSCCAWGGCDRPNPKGPIDLDNHAERTISEFSGEVSSVVFCDGASGLACGDVKGNLSVWRVDSGRARATALAHPGGCYDLAFVPTRTELISAGNGTALRAWDLPTLKRTHEFEA